MSTNIGFKIPSYKETDRFLQQLAQDSPTPFHPIKANHLVSRYYSTEAGGYFFGTPVGSRRKFSYLRTEPISIGFFWFQHIRARQRQYCCLLLVNNAEGYAALLDNNPNTDMILVVQNFLTTHCGPEFMKDFRIVEEPSYENP